MQSALYAITRLSVCQSVPKVDTSKTVDVKFMQLSPQCSQIPLVFVIQKF